MPVADMLAYQLLAPASYFHVYTLTGMPVSGKQVDCTTFDLLACNMMEGSRGATKLARLNRFASYGHASNSRVVAVGVHVFFVGFVFKFFLVSFVFIMSR